ncbi:MAG TPA: iron ABC transporter permease [Rubricoccaceae bacterium]|nr:iron ABC transporter permease [Rubricoccaceae bacterium]
MPVAVLRRDRWLAGALFGVPVAFVATGVVVPLGYLVLRALDADPAVLADLVFRGRTLRLLGRTLALAAGVLALTTALALPLAWLSVRSDLRGRRLLAILGAWPLAVPGYVMAYALVAATGASGWLAHVGVVVPRASGYVGAWAALSLYTFPYLFLNVRAALAGLDPTLEEAARALGYGGRDVLRRVVLPQLVPAYGAGALLVVLHVLGDFGVVSLMRYETFSYAVYLQYTAAFDRVYAAWLALMLLALTGGLVAAEAGWLRGLRLTRTGTGAPRRFAPAALGPWRWLAYALTGLLAFASVGMPIGTTLFWLGRGAESAPSAALGEALFDSTRAALPAAFLAAALALPVAYLGVRRPSARTRLMERAAYLGYATPPLAFALALVFFSLHAVPALYQTLALLVVAYALHFLAEAIGPVRSALYQAPPRAEEAARILGRSPLPAFFAATFPLLRRGIGVSVAFVFLSALKELPLTYLLAPLGFRSLSMGAWSAANEALFSVAAPYALVLMGSSTVLVALVLRSFRA